MLGRTNVVQRRRPTINGEIQNFVVASGNTISVGDFVSYKFGDVERSFDQRTIVDGDEQVCIYDKQNGKYLFRVKDSSSSKYVVYLLQVVGNEIEILDAFTCSAAVNNSIPCIEGGNIYFVSAFASSGGTAVKPSGYNVTVKHYAVVSDLFVEQTDISFTISPSDMPTDVSSYSAWSIGGNNTNYFGVCVKESHIFLTTYFQYRQGTSGSYYHSVACVVYKENNGNWIFETSSYLKDASTSTVGAIQKLQYFCYLDKVAIFVLFGSAYALGCFSYDDVNDVYTFVAKNNNYSLGCACDGRYLLQSSGNASSTNYVFDLNQSGFSYVHSFVGNNFTFVSFCGDGKFVFRNGNYLKFLYISGSTYTVFQDTGNSSDIIYILPNTGDKSFYIVSGLKYGVLNVNFETQNVQRGYFDGTVESYSGDYTVGFAKTGGVAGDTIQVYTPYQSS